ncbi:hypothetical protein JCM11491_007090 [Sporobolomyces phaffii]
MSFAHLPVELRQEIIVGLPRSDLVSLCLVSKAALALARPNLYRRVVFTFIDRRHHEAQLSEHRFRLAVAWSRMTEAQKAASWLGAYGRFVREADEAFERRFRFLERAPHLSNLIETVQARGDGTIEGVFRKLDFIRFLAGCAKLRKFVATGSLYHSGEHSEILNLVSPQITSLVLDFGSCSSAALFTALKRLRVLRILEVSELVDDLDAPDPSALSLPYLETIRWHANLGSNLFASMTPSFQSLVRLEVPNSVLDGLDSNNLSTLEHLDITRHVNLSPYNDREESCAEALCRILGRYAKLQTFATRTKYIGSNSRDDPGYRVLEEKDVLGLLPPGIRHADFSIAFPYRYLREFLGRASPVHAFTLRVWSVHHTRREEEELASLGRLRGIEVVFKP